MSGFNKITFINIWTRVYTQIIENIYFKEGTFWSKITRTNVIKPNINIVFLFLFSNLSARYGILVCVFLITAVHFSVFAKEEIIKRGIWIKFSIKNEIPFPVLIALI